MLVLICSHSDLNFSLSLLYWTSLFLCFRLLFSSSLAHICKDQCCAELVKLKRETSKLRTEKQKRVFVVAAAVAAVVFDWLNERVREIACHDEALIEE